MVRAALLACLFASSILAGLLLGSGSAGATDYYRRFPFARTETAYISQAYNGDTHQGADYYALDFVIEGTADGTVTAASAGRIVDVKANFDCDVIDGDYGNRVEIEITLPSGELRRQLYAHLASVAVSGLTGVAQGQKLGIEGDTGKTYRTNPNPPPALLPCGEHLHFRETYNGYAREPESMSGEPQASGLATSRSDKPGPPTTTSTRRSSAATAARTCWGAATITSCAAGPATATAAWTPPSRTACGAPTTRCSRRET